MYIIIHSVIKKDRKNIFQSKYITTFYFVNSMKCNV